MQRLPDLYIKEIVRLHGILGVILLDQDPRFTRTRLNFSIVYHLQTDGQKERTIYILEDMLRICVLEFKGSCI